MNPTEPPPRKRKGRALLVAGVGVAAVSFVACGGNKQPVGNLRGPDPAPDASVQEPTPELPGPVGNLRAPEPEPEPTSPTSMPAPPDPADAGAPAHRKPFPHPVGNLRPPPPRDGGNP